MGRRTEELLERAVSLPELRAGAAAFPVVLKAEGARLYDVDNIGYVDYVGGGGAAIVGFSNQFVIDAVRKVLSSGVPGGVHVSQEVDLAESLGRFLPWVGGWWLCSDQDEAMAALLKWLRRTTGKDVVVRLDGGVPFSCESLSGDGESRLIRQVPGWNLDRIEAAVTGGASKVAAIVIDPLMSGCGVIPPPEGMLQRISEICNHCNVMLVLDERVSGFRVDRGGFAAAAGIIPDVAVYGGALGGGFSIGAVGFREGLSDLDSGHERGLRAPHVVSMAAAEAVLSVLKNDTTYERIESRAEQLSDGILALAERFSRKVIINRVGSLFSMFMSDEAVSDLKSAQQADTKAYERFILALRAEGVLFPSYPGGIAFVCNAHGAKDVSETLEACERIFMRMHQEDLP